MKDYKKKYEEALDNFKKIKAANKDNKELVDFIEYKYPELKESEYERIRKEILQSIQDNMCVIHKDKCIAWLEKHIENPTWSEEDEHCIELLLPIIDSSSLIPKNRKKCKKFLKSLKERVQPQPNQEWSEEEKARINKIIDVLDWAEEKGRISYSDWEDYVCYVKSLKPQSTWKPSDEQMKALEYYMNVLNCNEHKEVLFGLYEQLKSL